jgi:hypothetical protein
MLAECGDSPCSIMLDVQINPVGLSRAVFGRGWDGYCSGREFAKGDRTSAMFRSLDAREMMAEAVEVETEDS